jgi:pimeloyl-ACP methyl ester carboxylesterase
MVEVMMPGARTAWLRPLLAPVMGAMTARLRVPPGDLLVEAEAECTFAATDILEHAQRAQVPILMVFGDADEFIPVESFDESAVRHGRRYPAEKINEGDDFPRCGVGLASRQDGRRLSERG